MLAKIKSIYFLRIILNHLDESRKLSLIKYNKNLQNAININIINYITLSEKYIVKESNEKWKIYNGFYNDRLIFEGNYMNGKGTEYTPEGNLYFKGDYLNGKRNGKGKEFGNEGRVIFEGEYLNGKRHGKGKEFYNDGKLLSEGEFLDGKDWNIKQYDKNGNVINELKEGKGYMYEFNQFDEIIFKGEYLNGERNGKGKEFFDNDILIFEGEYLNGERNGKGKKYSFYGELLAEGEYLYGRKWNVNMYNIYNNKITSEIKNGRGILIEFNEFNNIINEREYSNGLKNGKIKYYRLENLLFEGEYVNGKKNGLGKEYNMFGKLEFEGEYLYNHRIRGKEYVNGRLEYEGEYLYDKKYNGKGYDEKGNIIYNLINGNGKVKEFNEEDNLIFEGEYLNGKRNGKGREYNNFGDLIYEGEYINGKRKNIIIYY